MPRLGIESPPVPTPARTVRVGLVATVAVVVALAVLATLLSRGPSYVPRLTIDNPTLYQVQVHVLPPGENATLALGAPPREQIHTVEQVIDQGAAWEFRFSYGRHDAGSITVSRDQLERDGWRITVPPEVGERLREAGFTPSY